MQKVAYYSCDKCNSSWHTGWSKDKRIEDMTDACYSCSVSESNEHVVAEPHLVRSASEITQ